MEDSLALLELVLLSLAQRNKYITSMDHERFRFWRFTLCFRLGIINARR